MTISQDPSAPLVVVCGATGIQGGSVIRALAESDRAYRFRGTTRDTTKATAQQLASQGVDMLGVSLSVGNEANVKKAFEGGNIAFIMTNFWEHMNRQREIDEGKILVDAALAAGVGLLVWSGLNSVTEDSGGKYTLVEHFDSKAEVTEYAKKSGIPLVVVQAGFYASNFTGYFKPKRQADGSYVVKVPINPDKCKFALIDMVPDYGIFVREAIESPAFGAGTEVLSCGEMLSFADAVNHLARFTGKNIKCVTTGDEEFIAEFPVSRSIALEVIKTFRSHEEFGYYGSKDIKSSQQHLVRKPNSWADYVRATDWDAILV